MAQNPPYMYSVYVIQSESHGTRYIGSTQDVQARLREHNFGKCRYTSGRRPWRLVRVEEFNTRSEAMKRERFLKTGKGRAWLDELLSN
ncbi:MAG: GIY-YIG nuclease family protein [Candidatus Uhrbacteria bacterium]